MSKYCYPVFAGAYGTTGRLVTVFDLKKDAKQAGYKYNTAQNLFLCDERSLWLRIEKRHTNAIPSYFSTPAA